MSLLAGTRTTTETCLYKTLKNHNDNYSGELTQQAFVNSQFIAMGNYFKENAELVLTNLSSGVSVPDLTFTKFILTFTPFVASGSSESEQRANAHLKFKSNFADSLSGIEVNGISFALGTQVMNLTVTGPEYEDCLEQISIGYVNWCKSLQLSPATGFSVLII